MSNPETIDAKCCGHCKHGEFSGRHPIGSCNIEITLPWCMKRFLPAVGAGTIRAVDWNFDGENCGAFVQRK